MRKGWEEEPSSAALKPFIFQVMVSIAMTNISNYSDFQGDWEYLHSILSEVSVLCRIGCLELGGKKEVGRGCLPGNVIVRSSDCAVHVPLRMVAHRPSTLWRGCKCGWLHSCWNSTIAGLLKTRLSHFILILPDSRHFGGCNP